MTVTEPTTEPATDDQEQVEGDEVVADELLVEEISIDGMCGVY
jgi:mycofactocin precursor